VVESRRFEVPALQMEQRAHAAVGLVVNGSYQEVRLGCWRGKAHHPMSLFDECEIEVAIGEEGGSCVVRAAIAFDASFLRVAAFVCGATSIIGTPAAYAWREISIGAARRFARETFDRLWALLDSPGAAHPYR
jgi:hypothetical protein